MSKKRFTMEQIIDIQEQLEDGEDFAELAREFSDDTTSANLGGDMGWFPPGAYGERVQMTLDALQPDEVSQPFQTAEGWHIVQLVGERETDRTEEAIRAEAREKIMRQRANEEIQTVLRQFRDEAFVVNDWYITAYRPIKNLAGKVIGILYVGTLKKPYTDAKWRVVIVFLLIALLGTMAAVALSSLTAGRLALPLPLLHVRVHDRRGQFQKVF